MVVDRQDRFGRTALFRAAVKGHTEAVRVLLEHNANPDVWRPNKLSPIYEAVVKRHKEVVILLLSRQPKIEIPTSIWSAVGEDQQMKDLLAHYGVTRQIAQETLHRMTLLPDSKASEFLRLRCKITRETYIASLFLVGLKEELQDGIRRLGKLPAT